MDLCLYLDNNSKHELGIIAFFGPTYKVKRQQAINGVFHMQHISLLQYEFMMYESVWPRGNLIQSMRLQLM